MTNKKEPTHRITYGITGAAHITELRNGDLLLVFTGRNLLFDEGYMILTIKRFTQDIEPESGASTPGS